MKKQKQQTEVKKNLWIYLMLWIISVTFTKVSAAQDTATFISDLKWKSAYAFGKPLYSSQGSYIRKDVPYNTEGGPSLIIGGVTYAKGISALASSEIIYDLGQKYSSFQAIIGILDNRSPYGKAIYKVFCDGNLVYTSGIIGGSAHNGINISVSGVSELRLVTEAVGSTNTNFESVWADARLKPGIPADTLFPAPIKMLHRGNSMSGNSLTNQLMQFAISAGYDYIWDFHINYYNNLQDSWNAGTDPATPRGRVMSGRYTHYDLQPASEEYENSASRVNFHTYGKLFYDLAKLYNLKVYLYCNWDYLLTSEAEQSKKDSVYKSVVDLSMGTDVAIVPVGRALTNIKKAWSQGQLPDFDPIMLRYQYNPKDNHPSDFGDYLNALVHFATVFQQSPIGFPTYNLLHNTEYGVKDSTVMNISDESILKMQHIVWNTVKSFSHARVDTTLLPDAILTSNKATAAINNPISFNASSSSPVSGASIIKYRWSFGDVISTQNQVSPPSGANLGCDNGHTTPVFETTLPYVSHAYNKVGKFWVRLVVVQDDGKTSSDFIIVNVTANADTVKPGVPANLTSSNITSVGFTLSWSVSTDNVGVTGYEIFRNGTSVGVSTTTSFNITGLSANTTYAMTVKAKDGTGNVSAASTPLNVTTSAPDNQAPVVPTGLSASSITSTGTVIIAWKASTDNVGVTGYEVFRDGTSVGTTADTTISIGGLTCGSVYVLKVRARDAAGNWSAQSTALNVSTSACSDTQAPTAPTGLTSSSIVQTSFTLSWTASTDNVGVVSYEIFKNGVSAGTATSTTFNLTGLTAGQTYTITVKAKDAAGNVSAAGALNVTTLPTDIASIEEGITLYPNPASDIINIINVKAGSIVSVYDLNSILLIETKSESDQLQINVAGLSKGLYLIKINNKCSFVVVKFLKE